MPSTWHRVGPDALAWLRQIASDGDPAGFGVGPMPDKAFVLHPLSERVDGQPIESPTARGQQPAERIVRWHDYALRHGIPMFVPPGFASGRDALPGVWTDEYVNPPAEGSIEDERTRRALFDVLIAHSAGSDAMATAYFWDFHVSEAEDGTALPNILRGPLTQWTELFDRPGYPLSPQNLWPDDRRWVLGTHVDSWATEISGPPELVADILAAPDLEAIRLPHLS